MLIIVFWLAVLLQLEFQDFLSIIYPILPKHWPQVPFLKRSRASTAHPGWTLRSRRALRGGMRQSIDSGRHSSVVRHVANAGGVEQSPRHFCFVSQSVSQPIDFWLPWIDSFLSLPVFLLSIFLFWLSFSEPLDWYSGMNLMEENCRIGALASWDRAEGCWTSGGQPTEDLNRRNAGTIFPSGLMRLTVGRRGTWSLMAHGDDCRREERKWRGNWPNWLNWTFQSIKFEHWWGNCCRNLRRVWLRWEAVGTVEAFDSEIGSESRRNSI